MPQNRFASRRTFILWGVATALVAVTNFFWSFLDFGGHRTTQIATDLISTTVPTVVGVVCLLAWRRMRKPRLGWFLIGAATLAWALGDLVWTIYEIPLHRSVPFPSLADLGYLSFIPLAAAAMIAFNGKSRLTGRVRAVLDGVIVLLTLLFISWSLLLGPMFAASADSLFSKAVGLAYPAGDIVIITMAITLTSRAPAHRRLPMAMLSLGILSLGLADSAFSYLTMYNKYDSASMIDFAWPLGFMLIGYAAIAARRAPNPVAEHDSSVSTLQALLPYIGLLPGVGLFSLEHKVEERTVKLRESEERSHAIIATANDAFLSIDHDGKIIEWNQRAEQMLGIDRDDALDNQTLESLARSSPSPKSELLSSSNRYTG